MRSFGRPRVLVCDDEESVREMCRRVLTMAGYDAFLVDRGALAVEAVKRESFDVALIDMRMPGMDGVEVLRAFREHDPDLPCVVISGYSAFEDSVECIRHGAVDFLTKPFDLETVVRAIDRADASTHLKVDSALLAATQSIFSSLDSKQISRRVLGLLRSLLSASSASITLGRGADPIETFRISGNDDVTGPPIPAEAWRRVIEWRDPTVLVADVPSPDGELINALAPDAHAALVQRLVFGDRVVGMMLAARSRRDRGFGERDLRRAMVLAGHVALALENARLHAETEAQAFEIERAFDRLVVAERVATMARLSQGLGHEIANPACAVLASLDVAQIALDAGKTREARDAIRHAQVGTNAVLDVCQALRPLAGGRSKREELVDLRRVVDGALLLATYELRPKAQVRTEIPRELPYLVADPAKLGQVLLNLLLNAAQAIESGAPERNAVTVRLEARNGEIICQVEDTGRGVSPEVGPKLFDTNVTTKVNAEGHGMGLAICKWIVEEAGGTIRWVPNRDRGTVFEVRLPFRKDRG